MGTCQSSSLIFDFVPGRMESVAINDAALWNLLLTLITIFFATTLGRIFAFVDSMSYSITSLSLTLLSHYIFIRVLHDLVTDFMIL